MNEIRFYDSRIKNLGIDTLLFTEKHPLALEEDLDALTEEWPTFEFEKKKPFKYEVFVTIERPAASGEEQEEESKGDNEPVTEDVKVGLKMEVKAIEGEKNKWALEFSRLRQDEAAKTISGIDFYKAFDQLTEIYESIADEE
jgi:hypothetical protein